MDVSALRINEQSVPNIVTDEPFVTDVTTNDYSSKIQQLTKVQDKVEYDLKSLYQSADLNTQDTSIPGHKSTSHSTEGITENLTTSSTIEFKDIEETNDKNVERVHVSEKDLVESKDDESEKVCKLYKIKFRFHSHLRNLKSYTFFDCTADSLTLFKDLKL